MPLNSDVVPCSIQDLKSGMDRLLVVEHNEGDSSRTTYFIVIHYCQWQTLRAR